MTHKVEEQNVKNKIMIFNFILVMVAKKVDCSTKKDKGEINSPMSISYTTSL